MALTAMVVLLGVLALQAASTADRPEAAASDDDTIARGAMAGLGDSITRGFGACDGLLTCADRSWSTGWADGVRTHFTRMRGTDPTFWQATNLSRLGASVADLEAQARVARDLDVGYVTILIGANDACTDTEAAMTPVASFEATFRAAVEELDPDRTDTRVFVSSIPDLRRLWEVAHGSEAARRAWERFGVCPSMLADPTSTAEEDVARRGRVHDRVAAYNDVMARVCDRYTNCDHDDGAAFAYAFERRHLSPWDFFHPSRAGHNVLSKVTWDEGFDW